MASSPKHKESPAEPFKRVLGLAVRAIAGDGEMQVNYAPACPHPERHSRHRGNLRLRAALLGLEIESPAIAGMTR